MLRWLRIIIRLVFALIFIIIIPVGLVVAVVLDVPNVLHWLGRTGLFCQLAENGLICLVALAAAICLSAGMRRKSNKKTKKEARNRTGCMFVMRLIACVVMGYCCYNMFYIILDLQQSPVTENIRVEKVMDYTTRAKYAHHHEEIIFQSNGKDFFIEMPKSVFYDWSFGPISVLDHILSFPRNAELTYYPNSATVDTIQIL